jgi:hypothetical protein
MEWKKRDVRNLLIFITLLFIISTTVLIFLNEAFNNLFYLIFCLFDYNSRMVSLFSTKKEGRK